MIRHRVSMLAALLIVLASGACAVPKTPIGAITAVRDIAEMKQGVEIYRDFNEVRKRPIPLRGTYKLTYTIPGDGEYTFFVRTLWNANVPIAIADQKQRDGVWVGLESYDLGTAYMVNAIGAETYDAIPASIDSTDLQTATIGGFLVVTDEAGADESGRTRYIGGWMITPRDSVGESPGARVYRAMRAAAEAQRAAEKRMSRAELAAQPQDAFEAMNTIFYLSPDGSVTASEVARVGEREFFRVKTERVDTIAYRLPPENLKSPFGY